MRTAVWTLNGAEYPLCFSVRVVRDLSEKFGGVEHIADAIDGAADPVSALNDALWILERLMDAGARYAALEGREHPKALTRDELYDRCSMEDLAGIRGAIRRTIDAGKQTTVEVEPPKNAGAPPEQG